MTSLDHSDWKQKSSWSSQITIAVARSHPLPSCQAPDPKLLRKKSSLNPSGQVWVVCVALTTCSLATKGQRRGWWVSRVWGGRLNLSRSPLPSRPHEGKLASEDGEVDRAPAVAAAQVPKLSMRVFATMRRDSSLLGMPPPSLSLCFSFSLHLASSFLQDWFEDCFIWF